MALHGPNSTKLWQLLLTVVLLLTCALPPTTNAFTSPETSNTHYNIFNNGTTTLVVPLQNFAKIHHFQVLDGQIYINNEKINTVDAQLDYNIKMLTPYELSLQNIPSNYNALEVTDAVIEVEEEDATKASDTKKEIVEEKESTEKESSTSLKDTNKVKDEAEEVLVKLQSPEHINLIKSAKETIDNLVKSNHLLNKMAYKIAWSTAGNLYVTLLDAAANIQIVPSVVNEKAMLLVNASVDEATTEPLALSLSNAQVDGIEKTSSKVVKEEITAVEKDEEKVQLLKNEIIATEESQPVLSKEEEVTKVVDTKNEKDIANKPLITKRVIELPPQKLFPNLWVEVANRFIPKTTHRIIPTTRTKGLSTIWMHQVLPIEEDVKIVDGIYYYDGLPAEEYHANQKINRHESLPPEPMETITLNMGNNLKVGAGLTAPPPPTPEAPKVVYIDNIPYVNGWRISKAEADAVCAMSKGERTNRYSLNADTGDDAVASYRIVFRNKNRGYSNRGVQKVALTDINKGGKPCHAHYGFNWNTKKAHPYKYKLSEMPDTVVVLLPKGVGTDFDMPIRGRVTSHFGMRWGRPHNGIDLDLDTGDAVKAAFKGRVRCSYYSKSYGNIIIIRHYNGLETYYAHLSRRDVRVNEYVEAGQVIGLGGSTGRSTGSHLHFEVRYKGHPINPAQVVNLSTFRLHGHTFIIDRNSSSPSNPYSNKHYAGGSHWSVETASAGKGHYGHSHYNSSKRSKSKKTSRSSKKYHKVRRGDSLSKIAQRYGTSMRRICSLNGISKRTTLKVGRSLRVR